MAKEKRILVEKKGGKTQRQLLAQLKRDSSGGEAIVLHGISASKHVATINSHSVCINFSCQLHFVRVENPSGIHALVIPSPFLYLVLDHLG
uniref:Uncharacterized protein n=1 Tax=Oryza meridionalis TaxID=40149 RepID=A0A0E0EQ57_9ORYZ